MMVARVLYRSLSLGKILGFLSFVWGLRLKSSIDEWTENS